jgi:pseudouridylate synthase
MRLDKFLANSGVGSRKEVKELIKQGLVFVNEERIKSSDKNIDENKDIIKVNNKLITYKKHVYIMLNKPKNVISATDDNKHKTVIDLIKGYDTYNIFPVGRLDIDTEGLLLLTNDGKLSHNLLSPKKHVEKEYLVKLKENINDHNIHKVENSIELEDGYVCKRAKISKISENELTISITEGKFHQVKRMFKAVNNEVIYLKRIRMGNLLLDKNLMLGEYRELSSDELKGLITNEKDNIF